MTLFVEPLRMYDVHKCVRKPCRPTTPHHSLCTNRRSGAMDAIHTAPCLTTSRESQGYNSTTSVTAQFNVMEAETKSKHRSEKNFFWGFAPCLHTYTHSSVHTYTDSLYTPVYVHTYIPVYDSQGRFSYTRVCARQLIRRLTCI